jgi:hypothetical protein
MKGAIVDLFNLLNCEGKPELENKLKQTELIIVRNKIASHSTNYSPGKNEPKENYVPIRVDLRNDSLVITQNRGERNKAIDLELILEEFLKIITDTLFEVFKKTRITLIQNSANWNIVEEHLQDLLLGNISELNMINQKYERTVISFGH